MSKRKNISEKKISGDMIIADVVEKYPLAAEIMGSYGLSCIGCHANPYESIEAGAAGHGMSDEQIASLITELNELAAKGHAQAEKPAEGEKKDIVPVVITESAVNKVKSIMESQNKKDYGLRVGVKRGGCAGFSYFMDFVKTSNKEDMVLEFNGLRVFVDPQSAELLSGVEIDYLETLTESGFKFNNPHAQDSCGCGKSFS